MGLSGGRAVFVAAQWPYFAAQPLEIAWLWRGGLSYHGLLLAGLLALWGWSRRYKRAFGQDADLIAPALALLPAFGWTACWLGGCAYGRVAAPGLLAGYAPDLFGVYALRYQTQLLGLAWNLPLFALLWRLNGRWPAGRLFWLALFLVSSGHFLITWLRGDAAPWLGPWRLDTWLDGSLALISLVKWRRCKPVTAVTKV